MIKRISFMPFEELDRLSIRVGHIETEDNRDAAAELRARGYAFSPSEARWVKIVEAQLHQFIPNPSAPTSCNLCGLELRFHAPSDHAPSQEMREKAFEFAQLLIECRDALRNATAELRDVSEHLAELLRRGGLSR